MADSLKLAEMQRTSIEFERQRHLANWFIKSSPHMATPSTPLSTNGGVSSPTSGAGSNSTNNTSATQSGNVGTKNGSTSAGGGGGGTITTTNPLFFLMSSNGNTGAVGGNGNPSGSGGGKHASGTETAAALNVRGAPHPAMGGNFIFTHSTHLFNTSQTNLTLQLLTSNLHHQPASPNPLYTHANGKQQILATSATTLTTATGAPVAAVAAHHVEGRKPKLRRFNSHDTGANMFSVADFENARLARRNEIEMKQRLQRRMKMSGGGAGAACLSGAYAANCGGVSGVAGIGGYGSLAGGDCSTGDSKGSKHSNDSQTEPLPAEIFLDRYTLPRVVRISYKTKFSDETLQSSSSSNGSSMATTSSSGQSTSGNGTGTGTGTNTSSSSTSSGNINTSNTNTTNSSNNNNTNNSNNSNNNGGSQQHCTGGNTKNIGSTGATTTNSQEQQQQQQQSGELFLLYRLVRQRHIYHGFNAKTGVAHRKKGVMIPQEFPGYFSLINEKGLPTAMLYTTLIQLVRERVYKFVSVDNMSAFTESQPSSGAATQTSDGCLSLTNNTGYHSNGVPTVPPPANTRPQYIKTTARGGQVFRLLAVFEDGKQDHSSSVLTHKPNGSHGREKEKGRYAQLLNEQRQVLYVSLATKGKFYEIEPGIPQILQKLCSSTSSNAGNAALAAAAAAAEQHKVNADCVHRITALLAPQHKELPQTLRFISGPTGSANSIPEQLSITKISTETVVIACPIEDVEVQSPLHLRKLHLSADMQLVKCSLGFETEQRMFANPNVQNMLKFCQFNCDQFLRMVEVEVLHRAERSGSKSRSGDALRILKPLHLPKLLRREKTTLATASAHEKEDSIIFLSKHDLANLEAKEQQQSSSSSSRISDKMKVFQTTKKKWFRRQDKHAVNSLTSLDLDVQAKRMSIERYSDMSKLLQERFGDKRANGNAVECISERSISEIGCSDTETTTLHSIATIEERLQKFSRNKPLQKSQSLQDVELIGCGKPDLLRSHHATTDTISEAGTDLEDMENRPPSSIASGMQPQQSSFITEKLYTEFHVKTRQYSKSSSSLHQLLHFAVPQKLQLHEQQQHQKRSSLAHIKQQQQQQQSGRADPTTARKLDFNIGEPVTGRRAAGGLSLLAHNQCHSMSNSSNNTNNGGGHSQNTSSLVSPLTPSTSMLEDDLPYSSVRDSLVLSSDDSGAEQSTPGQICQALHLIDYAKENIYAEICHDVLAPTQARANVLDECDEYGDYASLTPPYMSIGGSACGATTTAASGAAQAISRVHINCSSSPVSYHTVYLGDEPLGEQYAANRKVTARAARSLATDMANITTVECVPNSVGASLNHYSHNQQQQGHDRLHGRDHNEQPVVDNIYNTLK